MALKLNTKVLVPPKPPDISNLPESDESSGTTSALGNGENSFRKHLYNQTVVSGW